jgi:DNA repair ATPase RecN
MKLKIKNYSIIANLELETKGITLITGRNNHGKSAFIRAIRAACFGQPGHHFIKNGEKRCEVDISFGESSLRWEKTKDEALFYINGKKYEKTGGKPPEEYVNALKIFSLEPSKLSYRPNFSPQFEPLFLIYSGPTECAAALAFLFSGHKFPALLKTISGEIKSGNKEGIYIEGQIDQKEKEIQTTKKTILEFDVYQKWVDKKEEALAYINIVDDLDIETDTYMGLEKDFISFQEKIAVVKNKYDMYKLSDGKLVDEVENINVSLESHIKAEKELCMLEESRSNAYIKYTESEKRLSEIVNSIESCPFCGNSIGEQEKSSLLN